VNYGYRVRDFVPEHLKSSFGTDTDFGWAYLSGDEDTIADATTALPDARPVALTDQVD
jgi:hypothetical protein